MKILSLCIAFMAPIVGTVNAWQYYGNTEIDPQLLLQVTGATNVEDCKAACMAFESVPCEDTSIHCPSYLSKGWCDSGQVKNIYCPKSCGTCTADTHATCVGIAWSKLSATSRCALYRGATLKKAGWSSDHGSYDKDAYLRTDAVATGAICGNGHIEAPEACDDGNVNNGDGCSQSCTVESEFTCSGSPSRCAVKVHCLQSPWANAGVCSRPCGTGSQQQTRVTIHPAANGGAECGPTTRTVACNTEQCTADHFHPPAALCSNCFHVGSEYWGASAGTAPATGAVDCQTKCNANIDCEYFVYLWGTCHMKKAGAKLQSNDFTKKWHYIAGPKHC